jgi:hypothetical protein
MPPLKLSAMMDELVLQADFQAVNAKILAVSHSANRVICYIRADFEWKGGVLKPSSLFNETFHLIKKYRQHFHAMPEAASMIEEIAWQLLHTAYWQAYYAHYGRTLPSREAFHEHYFVALPGKQRRVSGRKPTNHAYAMIPGYVYVIDAVGSGRVKIGRTATPLARLETLDTASPYDLKILRQIKTPDAAELENQLHTRYAQYKVRREWYALPLDVLDQLLQEDFS